MADTAWPPGEYFIDAGSPADLAAYLKSALLARGRSIFQAFEIFANPAWGRMLSLDGRLQSAERDEFI